MEISGTNMVNASRERVWAALNDPSVLERCVPGVSDVKREGNTVRASLELVLGRVRGVYQGRVQVLEEQAPDYARFALEGQAPVGVLRGESSVRLEGRGDLTLVHWTGQSRFGGALALVGRRVFEGVVRAKANTFFERLNAELNAPHVSR